MTWLPDHLGEVLSLTVRHTYLAGVPLILVGDKRMQGFSPKSFEDLLK